MYAVRRRFFPLVFGAAVLVSAGCSDSTAPADGDGDLTADERSELAVQIGALFAQGLAGSALGSAANDASLRVVPAPFHISFSATVPCPKGGTTDLTVTADGTIDEATESVTATVSSTNRPTNCGIDVHGKTFLITGEFESEASASIVNGEPVGENTASLRGEFDWRTPNGRRSGHCSVNYVAKANYTTKRAEVTGQFCGALLSVSGPLTS
jgi:hypothetical protein